jgi:hypothetical protein
MLALATSNGDDPFQSFSESETAEGFSVTRYRERDYSGVIAKKQFANLSALQADFDRLADSSASSLGSRGVGATGWRLQFGERDTLFDTSYVLDAQLPLPDPIAGQQTRSASGFPELDALSTSIVESIVRSADMRVIVELPVAARAHNATRVSADGKRLEWDLFFGQTNPANMEVSVPKLSPLLFG